MLIRKMAEDLFPDVKDKASEVAYNFLNRNKRPSQTISGNFTDSYFRNELQLKNGESANIINTIFYWHY